MSKVVVVGAGGHAKVIIDLLRQGGHEVIACADPSVEGQVINGVQVLGSEAEVLPRLREQGAEAVFVALGDNRIRRKVADRLLGSGWDMVSAIGRSAVVSPSAKIGIGCAIMEGAIINADTVVGDFAIINTNASVDHDCRIGAFAHVAPGSALAGCVDIGEAAFLGAGVRVIPGVAIAAQTIVGAGTVVVRNIDLPGTWVGVPSKRIR